MAPRIVRQSDYYAPMTGETPPEPQQPLSAEQVAYLQSLPSGPTVGLLGDQYRV